MTEYFLKHNINGKFVRCSTTIDDIEKLLNLYKDNAEKGYDDACLFIHGWNLFTLCEMKRKIYFEMIPLYYVCRRILFGEKIPFYKTVVKRVLKN